MRFLIFSFALVLSTSVGMAQSICNPIVSVTNNSNVFPGCSVCRSSIEGTTFGYTKDTTVTFDFPCGEIENNQWFHIKSDDSGFLEIRVSPRTCSKGIEIALYDKDLNLLGDCAQLTSFGTEIIQISDAPVDESYYVMVDGIEGDNCEFRLSTNGGNQQSVLSYNLMKTPNRQICKGEEVTFFLDLDQYVPSYNWEIPVASAIVAGGEPLDSFVTLKSEEQFFFDFKVNPAGVCNLPDLRLFQFAAADHIFQYLEEMEYCREDIDLLPADSCIIDPNGCDSCFNYRFTPYAAPRPTIVDSLICIEDCLMIGDSCYNQTGEHVIVFDNYYPNGCDSFVVLNLTSLPVIPSLFVSYVVDSQGITLSWTPRPSMTHFEISVNRDSFTTTTDSFILISNLNPDEEIFVKIQPFGRCDYLPAELGITNSISSVNKINLENKLLVVPNPTDGKISIQSDLRIDEVTVYDATGRFLQKEKSTSFDLKSPASGIYFLKIRTDEGVGIKRVLVSLD